MTTIQGRGLIIAAPSSGSGKTTITLGLLRALRDRGITVQSAKSGPDYIDPHFHQAACGTACINLDAWAMTPARLETLAPAYGLRLIEGAMGLFDGAPPDGKGSVADLARILKLPVVLVVDCAKIGQSMAAIVQGFANFDPNVHIAGVILNKIGSDRHETMVRRALAPIGIPVLGAVRRDPKLSSPSRHLGLVQAQERKDLETFIRDTADVVARSVDLEALQAIASDLPAQILDDTPANITKTLAVASDAAFSFMYTHWFADLVDAGWTVRPFSPLRNEPVPKADAVFLSGGYPELHAETLSNASNFMDSLRKAAQTIDIYGECGGYMALGDSLTDADGVTHKMAGLLPVHTSFAERKLHLGYRTITSQHGFMRGTFKAHEFHYATTEKAGGEPLFKAQDAEGTQLPDMGLRKGRVSGSFAHIIDRACPSDMKPLPLFS